MSKDYQYITGTFREEDSEEYDIRDDAGAGTDDNILVVGDGYEEYDSADDEVDDDLDDDFYDDDFQGEFGFGDGDEGGEDIGF